MLQDAIRGLEPKLARNPSDAGLHLELVGLLGKLAEPDKALLQMEKATNLFPADVPVMRTGTIFFSEREKKEPAIACARRLTELAPADYTAWLLQAQVLFHFDDQKAALEALHRAWEIGGAEAKIESDTVPELRELAQKETPTE